MGKEEGGIIGELYYIVECTRPCIAPTKVGFDLTFFSNRFVNLARI